MTPRHQLDYVFASRGLHERVQARALNKPSEWKSSDHCRLLVEVEHGGWNRNGRAKTVLDGA